MPYYHLGLPLRASYKSKAVWDPVVERFHKRLIGWKSKLLYRRGRLTLLKSSLWSFPVYFMSLFTIPTIIANQLEKNYETFFGILMIMVMASIGLIGMKYVILDKREVLA